MTGKTDNTLFLLSRVHQKANALITRELEAYGHKRLKPSHGDILLTLSRAGSATMSELAKRINKDPSTVTTLVKKLETLGYVETQRNPADQRSHLVHLTEQGESTLEPIKAISEKLYDALYAGISEEERLIFREILTRIYESFT